MLAVLHLEDQVRLAERRIEGDIRVGEPGLAVVVQKVRAVDPAIDGAAKLVGDSGEDPAS